MSVYQKLSLFLLGSSNSNFSVEFLMSKKENFLSLEGGEKKNFSIILLFLLILLLQCCN